MQTLPKAGKGLRHTNFTAALSCTQNNWWLNTWIILPSSQDKRGINSSAGWTFMPTLHPPFSICNSLSSESSFEGLSSVPASSCCLWILLLWFCVASSTVMVSGQLKLKLSKPSIPRVAFRSRSRSSSRNGPFSSSFSTLSAFFFTVNPQLCLHKTSHDNYSWYTTTRRAASESFGLRPSPPFIDVLEDAHPLYDVLIALQLVREAQWPMSQQMFEKYHSLVCFPPSLPIKSLEPDADVIDSPDYNFWELVMRNEIRTHEAKTNLLCRTSATLQKSSTSKAAREMTRSALVSRGGHGLVLVASSASLHDRMELIDSGRGHDTYQVSWSRRGVQLCESDIGED